MKLKYHKRKALFLLAGILGVSLLSLGSENVNVSAETIKKNEYFYSQLQTKESIGIYDALREMYEENKLLTGTYTYDLKEGKKLTRTSYTNLELKNDFVAARDAFKFDYPELFYVDFSKMSISSLSDGRITLGVGRESNYFSLGFDSKNVEKEIATFNTKVDSFVSTIDGNKTQEEKVSAVYSYVLDNTSYKSEFDASSDAINYVRNSYGALVKKEGVCEAYSTAIKVLLDKLNIENILVQGPYKDDEINELHMWNLVKMDDYRWYLIDGAMGDGTNNNGNRSAYYLQSGLSSVSKCFIPDGNITSPDLGIEFTYPTLSAFDYGVETSAFEFNDNSASYNGMNVGQARENKEYLLYSPRVDQFEWHYVELYHKGLEQEFGPMVLDYESSFNITAMKNGIFAATDIPYTKSLDDTISFINKDTVYKGSIDNIYNLSKTRGVPYEYIKKAPFVLTKTPNDSRLNSNQEYNAVVTFTEDLKIANNGLSYDVKSTLVEVKNITWSDDKPNQIRFSFTTLDTYIFSQNYYFEIKNLIGKDSKLAPEMVCFTVVNNPSFYCPKVEGSLSEVYATTTPKLIANEDLSTTGWKNSNGNTIKTNFPSRLSLVTSTIEKDYDYMSAIENVVPENNIKGSATYSISLSLCNNQVSYVSGHKIKVLMPFPEGFEKPSSREGVNFKAYHFTEKNGIIVGEEIDCVVTDSGIIMFCDSFSPFTILATNLPQTEKNVYVHKVGNGNIEEELIKISSDEDAKIKFEEDNSKLDYVKLNGSEFEFKKNEITITYNDLSLEGNILEISFLDNSLFKGSSILPWILIPSALILISGGVLCYILIRRKKQS